MPATGAASHAAAAFSFGGEPDHAVLHGLYWLLEGLGPAAILVDDAHWLDRQSLRWLAYMVNRAADLPLALILAARSDEPDELLTRIAHHPSTRVLTPKPLSRAAIATLAGEEQAAELHEATGGNPFYVHALLAEDGTPREVVESIALRLDRLPPAAGKLARAIAVVGSGGTIAARLAGLDVRTAVEAAEALTTAHLLTGDTLAHPLVQQAVYATIGAAGRAELHAAAARLVTGPERVAAHVMASGPGGGVWAAQQLRTAAAAAWARGAPDVAATFLGRAVEEELPRAVLVPLLRELARALVATSGPEALPVLREALALAEPEEREGLLLDLGQALFIQGYFPEAAAVFEQATSDEARAELATVAVLDLKLVRRFGGLDALADQLPPGTSAVGAWIEVARHAPAATGAAHAEAALPSAKPSSLAGALVALMAAGRLEHADALWTAIADSARASGQLETLRFAVALRAIVRFRQGRVAEVEADLRELIAWLGELELPYGEFRLAMPWVLSPLLDALIERGELDEAQHWLTLTGLETGHPEVFGFTFLLDSLARLRLAQGRAGEALTLARECGRRQHAWGNPQPGLRRLGLDAGRRGRRHRPRRGSARRVRRAGRPRPRVRRRPRARHGAARARPDHGRRRDPRRGGRVPARLPRATRIRPRAGLPRRPRVAAKGAGTGRALRRQRAGEPGPQGPRRHRRQAAPRPTHRRGRPDPTQLRVATLAAGGRTNREIAERLFVTEKTVEGHLGAAYRKLGIASRSQLEAALNTPPAG